MSVTFDLILFRAVHLQEIYRLRYVCLQTCRGSKGHSWDEHRYMIHELICRNTLRAAHVTEMPRKEICDNDVLSADSCFIRIV
jgi:hypothetical protein